MASSGSQILAADFVALQDKAESLLGIGSTTRGYGQTVQSADVFIGNQISKAQWDALRYDIINIRYHQDGTVPTIQEVQTGDLIGYGANFPILNYDTLLNTAITNKFNVAASQSVISTINTATTSSTWTSLAECELTATFSTSNQARYFFNSGGKIRISSSITGGSSTAQVSAWKSILTSAGTKSFGADTDPIINYYTLTNNYQIFYQANLSTPYSANNYKLSAKTNVTNNSSGTATILYIKITLTDSYQDPAVPPHTPSTVLPIDQVDGTLNISVSELKASGTMVPSGTFTITSPSYSLSSISTT